MPTSSIATSVARASRSARLRVLVRGERVVDQLVDLRVRVAAAVRRAHALVAVEGREQRLERRGGFAGARAPAHQDEAELRPLVGRAGGGVAEEHALRHRHHLRVDADARQHLPDRLGDLGVVRIAVVGRMDRHAEAVRHAGLGEQLLRAVRVVGHGLELGAHAEEALGQELPRLDRLAFHHAADDRVAVDRHRDRLAHAHVAQRVLDRLAVLRRARTASRRGNGRGAGR